MRPGRRAAEGPKNRTQPTPNPPKSLKNPPPKSESSCRGLELFPRAFAALQAASAASLQAALNTALRDQGRAEKGREGPADLYEDRKKIGGIASSS